jgi:DNA-binding NarL/FixJ family response regulator
MSFDQTAEAAGGQTPDVEAGSCTGAELRIARRSAKLPAGGPCALAIIERNTFFRDCFCRSFKGEFAGAVLSCDSLAEIVKPQTEGMRGVALVSIISLSKDERDAELELLGGLPSGWRSVVLGEIDDLDIVLSALNSGANGYISTSTEIAIVAEALRFVSAGGTYVPAKCLFEARKPRPASPSTDSEYHVTKREIAVIEAIRRGKPNKAIAYDMNMCESTVKVHVRHIMKKLHARNRTEVAIKGAELGLVSLAHPAGAAMGPNGAKRP